MTTFPGHVAGAFLAIELVSTLDPSLGLNQTSVLIFGLLAGVFPDLDSLFYIGHMRDHHDTPTHTPLYWLVTFLILLGVYRSNFTIRAYVLAAFIGIASHLFLDWYGGRIAGLRVFYPISKKRYSLYPLQRDKPIFIMKDDFGKEYQKIYVSNKVLLFSEIFMVVGAIVLLVFKLRA